MSITLQRRLQKYVSLFILMMVLFPSIKAQIFSPYEWATYYAEKKAKKIKIDGDLNDWKNVKGFSLNQEKYFFVGQGMSSSRWKGPDDLYGHFKVMWDEEFIYLAVEVWDDKVTPPHGAFLDSTESGSWDDDGIEIMFDHDGCGKSRYYIGDSMHHEYHFVFDENRPYIFDNFWLPKPGAPQPLFTLPDGNTEPLAYPGEVMAKNNVTGRFADAPYFGAYHFLRTAKGYNLEVKMKLFGAMMKPINKGGHKIGFDICINDNDDGKGPLKQELHWSGMNANFWRDCKFFGTLILLE